MRTSLVAVALLAVTVPSVAAVSADAAPLGKVKTYANCKALNKDYPHGVGRSGAKDHVSGRSKPVTNFTRNTKVYNANTRRDADHDGVACEKR